MNRQHSKTITQALALVKLNLETAIDLKAKLDTDLEAGEFNNAIVKGIKIDNLTIDTGRKLSLAIKAQPAAATQQANRRVEKIQEIYNTISNYGHSALASLNTAGTIPDAR